MNAISQANQVTIYEIDGILVDLQLKEIACGTRIYRPAPEAFATLIYLIDQRPRTVTVDELRSTLWANDPKQGSDASEFEILRAVMQARQSIMDDDSKQHIVFDADTQGYRFNGDVLELEIQ